MKVSPLILGLGLGVVAMLAPGCRDSGGEGDPLITSARRARVEQEGTVISFSGNCPGLQQISATTVHSGTAVVSIVAPARLVSSIVPAEGVGGKIVLFESPDVTTLYSQYRQARTNSVLAEKNVARVKDMFDNQAATAKDLNQAESDAANARAAMAEFEAKMRAAGFKPEELERAQPGTVWLISDVPESQLHDVRRGELVHVTFSAFPDRSLHGRAEAIGEIVDPATRTVKVRVAMPNPGGQLLPGMFARVDFGQPSKRAVLVPVGALITVDAKDYMFVQTDSVTFTRRQVIIAPATGAEVPVLEGIQDGEKVVMRGSMLLKGLSFGY